MLRTHILPPPGILSTNLKNFVILPGTDDHFFAIITRKKRPLHQMLYAAAPFLKDFRYSVSVSGFGSVSGSRAGRFEDITATAAGATAVTAAGRIMFRRFEQLVVHR